MNLQWHALSLSLERLLPLIVLLPALGFLFNALGGRRLSRPIVHLVGVGTVACSFLFSVLAFVKLAALEPEARSAVWHGWEWFVVRLAPPLGSADDVRIPIDLALRLDNLSAVMLLVVTGVGSLIHLYSTQYMHDDESPARFFAYLNLFMFAMLLLVLGESLPVMFVGWEGVGLASYLLIGFWYDKDENARAGQKAFVVNRIGDLGFLLGIFLLATTMGTLSVPGLESVISRAPEVLGDEAFRIGGLAPSIATVAALCLFVGACGKSAQVPLYVWLPDAMAGPTPVSALIHAATMVTAGIYMVARMHFLFVLSGTAMAVIAIIGAVTALFAATIALTQNDIKKVLAYSTVSQLGFMFAAVGVGAYVAGIFHVVTHAFFKACLFLGAGSVIHAMHGEQDIRKMGGLSGKLPTTHWTFLAATAAIAGIPPLSGFFSKDAILWHVFARETGVLPGLNAVLYGVLIVAAMCTAFYMFRLYLLVFRGSFRGGAEAEHHLHESPWEMTVPLIVLAVLAVGAGLLNAEAAHGAVPLFFEHWLAPGLEEGVPHVEIATARRPLELPLVGVSIAVAFALGTLAFRWYRSGPSEQAGAVAARVPGLYRLVLDKWRIDELYDRILVRPLQGLARLGAEIVDPGLIDGVMVHGTAALARAGGQLLRLAQTGRVQAYAMFMSLGLAAILLKLSIPEADFVRQVDGRRVTVTAMEGAGYQYRWDFDGDGRWDTRWTSEPTARHRYGKRGRYEVRLEVKSPLGQSSAAELVRVRGGGERRDRAGGGDEERGR